MTDDNKVRGVPGDCDFPTNQHELGNTNCGLHPGSTETNHAAWVALTPPPGTPGSPRTALFVAWNSPPLSLHSHLHSFTSTRACNVTTHSHSLSLGFI